MELPVTTYSLPGQRKYIDIFTCMLLISLLLHGVLSVFVLIPARTMVQGRQPLMVDLNSLPPSVAPGAEPLADESEAQPEPASSPAESQPPPTEAEALRQSVAETLHQAAATPEVVHRSSIGLGITSGYFGSFAEGATLKDDIREYYFSLMRRLNETWWTHSASGAAVRSASFVLVVSRDGKVVACELLESSGNPEYDQLLRETVKLAEPLPPLPPSFPDRNFNAPIRFVPPLNLMLPALLRKPSAAHL